jgi:hypothetical protein
MALVTFAPSGEVCDTNLTVAQKGPTYATAATPPTVSLEDQLTAGTLGAQVQGAQQNYIIWKDKGTDSTRARWMMNSAAAVTAGLAEITTADDAGTGITLTAAGTV